MTITCYEWHFKNANYKNYTFCETIEECSRQIEKQYRCSKGDYIIDKKQLRQDDDCKIINEVAINHQLRLQL